jgi:Proteasome activator pa28 beta subunit
LLQDHQISARRRLLGMSYFKTPRKTGLDLYILRPQIALKEHDEKQLYLARQHVFDVRNMYAVLTDLIHKNISKARIVSHLRLKNPIDLPHDRYALQRQITASVCTRFKVVDILLLFPCILVSTNSGWPSPSKVVCKATSSKNIRQK